MESLEEAQLAVYLSCLGPLQRCVTVCVDLDSLVDETTTQLDETGTPRFRPAQASRQVIKEASSSDLNTFLQKSD